MALTNLAFFMLEPVKSTRSMTPLVRLAFSRLTLRAYACHENVSASCVLVHRDCVCASECGGRTFVNTVSIILVSLKSASDIRAPASTLPFRLPPLKEHLRRSSSLSV